MWFAGLRGAVSFGLALSAATKNRPYIVTTTLTIVVITTFVMGGFTERLLRFLGLRASENERLAFQSLISPPNNTYSSESKSVSSPPDGVHRFWKNFDNYVIFALRQRLNLFNVILTFFSI